MNSETNPKQLDISLDEMNQFALALSDKETDAITWLNVPQQVEGIDLTVTPTQLRGIYELRKATLQYCFAQPGQPRPTKFKVEKGSRFTLVRLKRFSTGEHAIEDALTAAKVVVFKDEIGWIRTLRLAEGNAPTQPLLAKAAKLNKLTRVSIVDKELTASDFRQLSRMAALSELGLKNENRPIAGLSAFRPAVPFASLRLDGKSFNDKVVSQLSLTGLRELSLTRTALSGSAMARLINANPRLTRVEISGSHVEPVVFEALANLRSLSTLGVTNCDLDDDDAAAIARIKSLGGLLLYETNLTDAGLQHLAAMGNLTFLRIDRTEITDAGLGVVGRRFPKLTTLYANHMADRLSADGIRSLANHPSINEIHVSGREQEDVARKLVDELRRRRRSAQE